MFGEKVNSVINLASNERTIEGELQEIKELWDFNIRREGRRVKARAKRSFNRSKAASNVKQSAIELYEVNHMFRLND